MDGIRSKGLSRTKMAYHFEAKIYPIGINWAVDVPYAISQQMIPEKGYIRIKGQINGFDFRQTLVPVKNSPYRLFVNLLMMKGGKTALGEVAEFSIEQNHEKVEQMYEMPDALMQALKTNELEAEFDKLSPSRKKDILKYLHYLKTPETLQKNVDKVIVQLQQKAKDVRIP